MPILDSCPMITDLRVKIDSIIHIILAYKWNFMGILKRKQINKKLHEEKSSLAQNTYKDKATGIENSSGTGSIINNLFLFFSFLFGRRGVGLLRSLPIGFEVES